MSSITTGARLPAWSKIIVFLTLSGILGSIAAITYVSLEMKRMAELAPNPKYVAALAKKIVELPEPLPEGFEYQVGMDMNFLRLVSLINRKAMQQYTIYDFPGTTNQKARKFTEDAYAYGMNTPSVVGKFTELIKDGSWQLLGREMPYMLGKIKTPEGHERQGLVACSINAKGHAFLFYAVQVNDQKFDMAPSMELIKSIKSF